jgi:hypothetical protein
MRGFIKRLIALDGASMALDEERRQVYETAKSRGIVRRGLKAAYRARAKGGPDADLEAYARAVGVGSKGVGGIGGPPLNLTRPG